MQQVWSAQGNLPLLSFMRRHDEDRLVHELRRAKTLQGTPAIGAHVQLMYAMHASMPNRSDSMLLGPFEIHSFVWNVGE